MNKIFKIIWNESKRSYVVVSEFANVNGGKKKLAAAVLAFFMGLSAAGVAGAVDANPGDGEGTAISETAKAEKDGSVAVGKEAKAEKGIAIGKGARSDKNIPGFGDVTSGPGKHLVAGGENNGIAIGDDALAGAGIVSDKPIVPGMPVTKQYINVQGMQGKAIYNLVSMMKINPAKANEKLFQKRKYNANEIKGTTWEEVSKYVYDSGQNQVAIGNTARALGNQGIAIGANAMAGRSSVVIGGSELGDGNDKDSLRSMFIKNNLLKDLSGFTQIAPKDQHENTWVAHAGEASVAIGTKAHSRSPFTVSIGTLSCVENNAFGAIAIGAVSNIAANGTDKPSIGAIAIGMGAVTWGHGNISLGVGANTWAEHTNRSIAVGAWSKAAGSDGVAIGSLSDGNRGGNMAGYFYGRAGDLAVPKDKQGSITAEGKTIEDEAKKGSIKVKASTFTIPTATATDAAKGVRQHVYEGLQNGALTANAGAVSVGRSDVTRQIINVAAGTQDTDAVNVAQLRNINLMVGADKGAEGKAALSDMLLDRNTLTVAGQDMISTELTDDNGNLKVTVKAKTAKVTTNPDGSYKVEGQDGLVKASDLANKLNDDKKERDKLRNEMQNITYKNAAGDTLKKGDDGKFYKVKGDGTLDKEAGSQDAIALINNGGVALGAANSAIKKKTDRGLGDLDSATPNVAVNSEDLKQLGWSLFVSGGKDGTPFIEPVKNNHQVQLFGDDLLHVNATNDKNDATVHKVTFSLKPGEVADAVKKEFDNKGYTPAQYVDENNKPLVRNPADGKYYYPKSADDLSPDLDKGEKTPTVFVGHPDDNPSVMTHVAPGAKVIEAEGPTKGLLDLGEEADPTNVATIGDLANMGFVIAGKGKNDADFTKQIKNAGIIDFVGTGLAKVTVEEGENGHGKVTVNVDDAKVSEAVAKAKDKSGEVPLKYVDADEKVLVKGDDGKYYLANDDGTPNMAAGAKEPAGVKVGGDKALPMQNVGRGTGDITTKGPTEGLADLGKGDRDGNVVTVADLKKLGFVVAAGDKYTAQVGHAQTLKFVGDGIAEVSGETKDDVRTITVKVDEKKVTEAVKKARENDGEAPLKYIGEDGKPLTKIDGKYYPAEAKPMKGKDGKMYKASDLNPDGTLKNADAKPIDGVAAPSGVKVDSEKPLTLSNVGRGTKDIAAPKDDNAPEADKAKEGLADLGNTAKADNVATVGDLKKMGFVIAGKDKDGKDVAGKVKNADVVEFEGTGLAKVITETKDGKHKVTVNVDEKEISKAVKEQNQDNALFTFEDKDKNPLRKLDDKFYKVQPNEAIRKVGDQVYKVADLNPDGTPKDGAKALTPISDKEPVHIVAPTGNNGQAAPLTNIGNNLKEIKPEDKTATAPTKDELQKIGNNAATINDVMNTGWNLKVNGKDTKVVKPFDTVEFVNGANTTVVADENGKLQVNVAGLPMAYTDKDGAPLAKVGNKYYALKADGTPDIEKEATPAGVGLMNPKAEKGKTGDPVALKNVAPGRLASDSTDAVNGSQLFRTEQKVARLGGQINEVGAGAAALAALHPLDFDPDEKLDFSVGYGNYKGEHAAAIGAHYRPNEDTMVSVGGSFGGGDNMVNAGVSFRFGQKNHVSNVRVAAAKDILDMQKRMAEMEAQMAQMQGFIAALTGVDGRREMFPDVPENHWAYEYIKGLTDKGIIEGYPNGRFDGDRSMTRYEFAAMLYRALEKGVKLDARAVKEFAPELARIRVDVISKDRNGDPTIERVRLNK